MLKLGKYSICPGKYHFVCIASIFLGLRWDNIHRINNIIQANSNNPQMFFLFLNNLSWWTNLCNKINILSLSMVFLSSYSLAEHNPLVCINIEIVLEGADWLLSLHYSLFDSSWIIYMPRVLQNISKELRDWETGAEMKNYIIPVRTLNTAEQLSSLATIILMLKLTPTLKFKLYCTKWKIVFI